MSSSGHLMLLGHLLDIQGQDVTFAVLVHAATVLATVTVFWTELVRIFAGGWNGLRNRQMNPDAGYILKIAISIIPVGVVGFFFREQVEALFGTSVPFVGVMLWVTAGLLLLTHFVRPKKQRPVGYGDALVIGLAQALAVVPGISRSGATIATGMLLGNDRTQLAKFSFLMVLVPVLGEALLELIGGEFSAAVGNGASWSVLIAGFLAAYVAGLFACRVMIRLVSRGKLYWFAIYCVLMGTVAVIWG